MTECDAILADVCASPEDMTPRLVYADWLDDHGEPARAELIRCQIHLHGLGGYGSCRDPRRGRATVGCGECRLCVFCRRHDELLTPATFWAWFGPLVTAGGAWPGSPAVAIRPDGVCEVGYFSGRPHERRWRLALRRGFVEEVECQLADWRRYSPEWFRLTPLRVYRPATTAASPRDEIMRNGVALWQDEGVGRLDTLDLSRLCRAGRESDLECLRALAAHAYRPWRGLRRLVQPAGTSDGHVGSEARRWRQLLPNVQVDVREGADHE